MTHSIRLEKLFLILGNKTFFVFRYLKVTKLSVEFCMPTGGQQSPWFLALLNKSLS